MWILFVAGLINCGVYQIKGLNLPIGVRPENLPHWDCDRNCLFFKPSEIEIPAVVNYSSSLRLIANTSDYPNLMCPRTVDGHSLIKLLRMRWLLMRENDIGRFSRVISHSVNISAKRIIRPFFWCACAVINDKHLEMRDDFYCWRRAVILHRDGEGEENVIWPNIRRRRLNLIISYDDGLRNTDPRARLYFKGLLSKSISGIRCISLSSGGIGDVACGLGLRVKFVNRILQVLIDFFFRRGETLSGENVIFGSLCANLSSADKLISLMRRVCAVAN